MTAVELKAALKHAPDDMDVYVLLMDDFPQGRQRCFGQVAFAAQNATLVKTKGWLMGLPK